MFGLVWLVLFSFVFVLFCFVLGTLLLVLVLVFKSTLFIEVIYLVAWCSGLTPASN